MRLQPTSLLLAFVLGCGAASDPDEQQVAAAPPAAASAAAESAPERVELERVESAALRAEIAASGTIQARRVTEISAEVPGRLVAVLVDVGDTVAAGEPLFRIEPGPYRMALAEAEAGLALARAERANAEEEAARLRLLLEQNAASQQRYDQLRTRAEVARAQVAQDEARVAKARRDLAETEVQAPYAGSVVERLAHEGAMAGESPILVLQESGALEAILNVPEATPLPVRVGDPVRLFVEGLADPLETRIERVSGRVDPGTRTYEVRGSVRDPSGALKAGSYVRAELSSTRSEPRPVVHRSALLTRDGRTFVLRIEEGVVRYAPVRVGVTSAERAEVLSGLSAGDLVVRGEAVTRLPEGVRVEVAGDGAGSATAQREPSS